MPELCLTVLCPPSMEEKLLDMLLLFDGVSMFSSAPVAVHGLAPDGLSQAEQVMGRALASEVRLVITENVAQALRDSLETEFAGAGLRYWTTPVLASGVMT